MKKLLYIVSRKWFYLFLVPSLLFIFGVLFALYHIISYNAYVTVMPVVQTHNADLQIPQDQLIDGEVVRGEFTASRNNLGAIALRIKDLHDENVPDNFHIYFRIKEKGAKKWYSSNRYNGGQFHDLDLFPFGFPLISNSMNKIYTFELLSKGATLDNALTINTHQSIVGQYQLQKQNLKRPVYVLHYLRDKLIYLFHNVDGIFSTLIYFLPLYGYFYLLAEKETIIIPLWISLLLLLPVIHRNVISPIVVGINKTLRILYKIKFLDEYKPVKTVPSISIFLFFTILVEIFLIDNMNNFSFFIIILLWSISIAIYHLRLQSSFLLAVGFLVLSLLLLLVRFDSFAEQAAIWSYLFLVIGAVHAIVQLRSARREVKRI